MKTHAEGAPAWEGEPGEGERGADPMGCPRARRAGARGHAPCQEAAAEECIRHHIVRLGVPCHSAWSAIISEQELSPLTPIPVPSSANAEATEERRGSLPCSLHFHSRDSTAFQRGGSFDISGNT